MKTEDDTKVLVIGATKPWCVKKLTSKFKMLNNRYDVFTTEAYKDFYEGDIVHTFNIHSIYSIKNIIKAFLTLFKKYDDVYISTIYPYKMLYTMVVIFAACCSRRNIYLVYREKISRVKTWIVILDQILSTISLIFLPVIAMIPMITLFWQKVVKKDQ